MTARGGASFDGFCRDAVDFLEGARVPYVVIGGLAVAALGEPRMTRDIDVVAYIDDARAAQLIDDARAAGFTVAPDELRALRDTGTLRFSRAAYQLDVIIASLPFETAARARARRHLLFGRRVPLPTAEDLLLFKVIAGRDKDLVDAVGIARRHLPALDLGYVSAALDDVCELAEDLAPRQRLEDVLRKAREGLSDL